MRTIKFRGKTFGGKWVEGYYVVEKSTGKHKITDGLLDIDVVRKETVGQFTGLKDKNGKELYEGDVLESNSNRHVVKYLEKGAMFAGVSTVIKDAMTGDYAETPLFQHWIDGCGKEVLGNIHDNPELIKT